MNERILSLDTRVRSSELFPRIRDAEKEMTKNEHEFRKRYEHKEYLKRISNLREKNAKKEKKLQEDRQIKLPSKPLQRREYFASFELTKDPKSSQYMPFDKVYFPKLFDDDVKRTSIDSMWMLGFQDLTHDQHS